MFSDKEFERLLKVAINISDVKKLYSEAYRFGLETEISNLLWDIREDVSSLAQVCEHPGLNQLMEWVDESIHDSAYMKHKFPGVSSLATIAMECACEEKLPEFPIRRDYPGRKFGEPGIRTLQKWHVFLGSTPIASFDTREEATSYLMGIIPAQRANYRIVNA